MVSWHRGSCQLSWQTAYLMVVISTGPLQQGGGVLKTSMDGNMEKATVLAVQMLQAGTHATLGMRHGVCRHHIVLSGAEGFALTTAFKRWINLVGRYRPCW